MGLLAPKGLVLTEEVVLNGFSYVSIFFGNKATQEDRMRFGLEMYFKLDQVSMEWVKAYAASVRPIYRRDSDDGGTAFCRQDSVWVTCDH